MNLCYLQLLLLIPTYVFSTVVVRDVYPLGPERIWAEGSKINVFGKGDSHAIGVVGDGSESGVMFAWEKLSNGANSSDGVYGEAMSLSKGLGLKGGFQITKDGSNVTIVKIPDSQHVVCFWDFSGQIHYSVYDLFTGDNTQTIRRIHHSGYSYSAVSAPSFSENSIAVVWTSFENENYSIIISSVYYNATTAEFEYNEPQEVFIRNSLIIATSLDVFEQSIVVAWKTGQLLSTTYVSLINLIQQVVLYEEVLPVRTSQSAMAVISGGGNIMYVSVGSYLYTFSLNKRKFTLAEGFGKNPKKCPNGCSYAAVSSDKGHSNPPVYVTIVRARANFYFESTTFEKKINAVVGLHRPSFIKINDGTYVVGFSGKAGARPVILSAMIVSVLEDKSRYLTPQTLSDTASQYNHRPVSIIGTKITPVLWNSDAGVTAQVLDSTSSMVKIGNNQLLDIDVDATNIQISVQQNTRDFVLVYDTEVTNYIELYTADSLFRSSYMKMAVGGAGSQETIIEHHATSQWYSHVVAWVALENNVSQVHYRLLKSTGEFCSEMLVPTNEGYPCQGIPSIAIYPSAEFSIIWQEGPCNSFYSSSLNTRIVFQTFSSDGSVATNMNIISKVVYGEKLFVVEVEQDRFQLVVGNYLFMVNVRGEALMHDYYGGEVSEGVAKTGAHFFSGNSYFDGQQTRLQILNNTYSAEGESISITTAVVIGAEKNLFLTQLAKHYWMGTWVGEAGHIYNVVFTPVDKNVTWLPNELPSPSRPFPSTTCKAQNTEAPETAIPGTHSPVTTVPSGPQPSPYTPSRSYVSGTFDTPLVLPLLCGLVALCVISFIVVLWYRKKVLDSVADIRLLEQDTTVDWRSGDCGDMELGEVDDVPLET